MSEPPPTGPDETPTVISGHGLLDLGYRSRAEAAGGALPSPEKPGDMIGRYRLVALLGEGGFGTVWKAAQNEPIQRELALKVIKPGLDSREISARFETERQALALMDHPNIAGVLDAGTTENGRPYFAMELVKGEPITDYCDHRRLGIEERLALFIPVCQAVQHAHQKFILHRDLKPSNILVATVDGRPAPKVIDFGIAKAVGGEEGEAAALAVQTRVGVVIGTPRYMSPEQAGSRPDVDTRSDVYSLGVILCELLTGQAPHPAQPPGFADALRWIRETDAVKPSTLAEGTTAATAQAAAGRGMDPRRLARRLRGDLDWITLKALEKDRSRRYGTAIALASDLQRHLAEEPVSAVAPSWHYQLSKFARRRRAALIAACLIALALVAGTVVSLWQASRAEKHRQEAEKNHQEAEHRYAQARDAVDKYLARVTDNQKLKETNFVDLRRELLQTALPFYEEMSQDVGDDPKLRSNRAWALGQLAWLNQSERKLDQADAAYRQAIAILAKLVKEFPNVSDFRSRLAGHHSGLAMVLQLREKLDEALRENDLAVKATEELTQRSPANEYYQCNLAAVLNNRAMTLLNVKRDEETLLTLKRAGALGDKLVKEHPGVAEFYSTLGTTVSIRADYLFRHGNYSEAADTWGQAARTFGYAIACHPADSLEARYELATYQSHQGMALQKAGNFKEAAPVLREAIEKLQSLADEFPSYQKFRNKLAQAQENLKDTLSSHKEIGDETSERVRAEREAARERERAEQSHPPRKFTFKYNYEDPGPRLWVREGANWTETQPSGKKNTATMIGVSVMAGIQGTTILRNGSSMMLFVPDVDTPRPLRLWIKKSDGTWASLGDLTDVE